MYPQLSDAEFRRRLQQRGADERSIEVALQLWHYSGWTVDEVLHVRWENIDLEQRMMQLPEIPERHYLGDDAWLAARAFAPEDDEVDDEDLSQRPESALERVLPQERPELLTLFEPNRLLSRQLDVFGQALLVGWMEMVERIDEARATRKQVRRYVSNDADGYEPVHGDPGRLLVPSIINTTVNGILDDLDAGGVANVQEMGNLLASLVDALDRSHGGNPYGEAGVFQQVLIDAAQQDAPMIVQATLAMVAPVWQRLLWLAECTVRGGAVLSPGRGEPLVGDEDEQLTYLLRLAMQQPGLAGWPELQRFVPRRAAGLLPKTEAAHSRFRKEGIPADQDLADRLAEEILERRHYTLDTVSVIELEELGIRRIVLTPEERPEPGYRPDANMARFQLAFFVDHVAGGFYGRAQVHEQPLKWYDNRRALVQAPAILQSTIDFEQIEPRPDGGALSPTMAEALAAVELVVLSSWRDLVVPEVRDQHYEIDRIRKAKGKRERAKRKGDVEIIRYLPRRLIIAREEREQAAQEGRRGPRRLYPVGAFSRRLPEGQKRSEDAEAFAKESGIPLAEHQTVVRPHWRGGTEQERAQAALNPELDVRRWKSWSALDLLRTRLAKSST